jgi:hypothetical protein
MAGPLVINLVLSVEATAPRRGMATPRITRPFRAAKIHQNGSSRRPRPAGAALAGVPSPQQRSSGRHRSAGAALADVHAPQELIFPGSPSS